MAYKLTYKQFYIKHISKKNIERLFVQNASYAGGCNYIIVNVQFILSII